MKYWFMILASSLFYVAQVYFVYSPTMKNKPYYYIVTLSTTLIGGVMWFYIAKNAPPKMLYALATTWDTLLISYYLLLPLLFFGVKVGTQGYIGVVLLFIGALLIALSK